MTANDFRRQVLQMFLHDVHRLETDNYDADRYSFDGVDRSQLFDVARHATYLEWFSDHFESIFLAFSSFEDQASRDLYIDLLRYRLAGHLHVRIRSSVSERKADLARFRQAFVGRPSELGTTGMFGALVHYDVEWNGRRVIIDTVRGGLACELVNRQYFFERDGVRVRPEPGDYIVDGGAFVGDSSVLFAQEVGVSGHVYAFDPVRSHHAIIAHNVRQSGFQNITLCPYGLGDRNVDAAPIELDSYFPGYRPSSGSAVMPMRAVDEMVAAGEISRVDMIKLDVEGGEMDALRGSRATIDRFRPRLQISIYHRPNDFFEIINYIRSLNLGYRLFLDHHTIFDEETVVYALTP